MRDYERLPRFAFLSCCTFSADDLLLDICTIDHVTTRVVTDATGAVIPGSVVSLTNSGTGFKRQAVTGDNGVYQFLQAPPGTYHVAVEKSGFATTTRDNVQLQVNTPGTLDLRMDVGATSDVVNVEADATAINTVDASIGNPFSEQQVRQLPLETRNVVELLSLQVGVTPTGEVLGARRDQNNITLDGADVNNNQNSGLMAQATATGTGGYSRIERERRAGQRRFQCCSSDPSRFRSGVSRNRRRSRSQRGTIFRRAGCAGHKERNESVPWFGLRIQPQHRNGSEHMVQQQVRRSPSSLSSETNSAVPRVAGSCVIAPSFS